MTTLLLAAIFVVHLAATLGLVAYGLNCYVMLGLFSRRRNAARAAARTIRESAGRALNADSLPVVTTQVAIFNEVNVAERAIRAVCAMDYPAGRHEVQILDDSTDETVAVVDRVCAEMRAAGHEIRVLRRASRQGFKAGALANGLEQARGDYVAVFDADFVPPRDFLLSTVPCFLSDPRLGFVQVRWGHLNRNSSMLTRAQSVGIDGHFVVEQTARCWNGLFMNFNGTAGVWSARAIRSAGGWQWDTLTEDLDLSYRVQFGGWRTMYLPDVVVPAELPEHVNAFRTQQFRWAKGSIQTLIKLWPALRASDAPWFKKVQAVLHMGGYLVHPLMLTLAVLTMPILFAAPRVALSPLVFAVIAMPLGLSIVAPTTMYLVSQVATYRDWWKRVWLLPLLMFVGVGFALSNTRAILEAACGKQSEFVRTPKRGSREVKAYRVAFPWVAAGEVLLGVYSLWAFHAYVEAGRTVVSPFIGIYAAGFLFIGFLTLCHSLGITSRPISLRPAR